MSMQLVWELVWARGQPWFLQLYNIKIAAHWCMQIPFSFYVKRSQCYSEMVHSNRVKNQTIVQQEN